MLILSTTEERGAPPIPHEGHFRVARLRGLGVVEDALAVPLQPPPGIVVDQLEPPVGPIAHVDVFDVGRITAGVGIAARGALFAAPRTPRVDLRGRTRSSYAAGSRPAAPVRQGEAR